MSVDEAALESYICDSLVSVGGYQAIKIGNGASFAGDFDPARGLDLVELFSFIEATQAEPWHRLVKLHGNDVAVARTRFADRLAKELDARGTVDVLRHGVVDLGVTIRLAFFRPAHGLTPELQERYGANRLTVTRQLPYQPGSSKTLDLCLFVNGIPVATAELKNALTGQGIENAVSQYRTDRDPKNVTLGRRAVVHFAVDTERVAMTTRLAGKATRFLPFNQGHNGGPGNPLNPDGHRTAYLWEQVWARDAWMDLLARFIHVEPSPKGSRQPGLVIFPRYHQWDAVLTLEADARVHGPGEQYLVQHSAGSGKSNTIAWLAHRLSTLHTPDDQKVFDKVVVITDRVVLDQQLQETIYQFEHAHGVVEKIDKDSAQLAEALGGEQARIIITTLWKFPVVLQRGIDLPNRHYAVIIDEAHSSQTGEAAKDLKLVLGGKDDTDEAELTAAEAEDAGLVASPIDPVEEALARAVAARGKQTNLSLFAFTATPKARTLELFGRYDPSIDRHVPSHLYSMRQAIEEGFILDVLANYMTYETFWHIEKKVTDDPAYETRSAQRAIARFVSLHEHNLAQKAEIIIEHFRAHVAHKIGGRAKAMVVTSSRLHAVRYKQALDRYITEHGYGDLKVLVAFSGTVDDHGLPRTETNLNHFPESETKDRFDTAEYQVLVVAEKFQTGFDQPLLYAMYVDKTLTGLAAVQTLSRLNRICEGKDGTFVLDFRNDADEIRDAFESYYGETIAPATDPNLLFDTRHALDPFGVLRHEEIQAVSSLLLTGEETTATARVYSALGPAVDRFGALDEDVQEQFRDALNRFVRTYSFLSQVVVFGDSALERDYLCCRALASLIRRPAGGSLDLGPEVELTHLRHEQTFEGSVTLDPGQSEVTTIFGDGRGRQEPEEESLSTIIERLNERFGTNWTDADQLFVDQIFEDLADHEPLQLEAGANLFSAFAFEFDKTFLSAVAGRLDRNEKIAGELLDKDELRQELLAARLPWVYARARVARQRVCPIGELLGPDREDQYMEYKSTLHWDIKVEAKSGIPEDMVIKTVAGFANSEHGGTLLIGVADDGTVFGLEDDYATFSKRGQRGDHDLFGQHLQNVLTQRLGQAAMALVQWEFHRIDGKDLCRIHVEPSGFPVYETKGDHRDFWWRFPTGTVRIVDQGERDRITVRRWPSG